MSLHDTTLRDAADTLTQHPSWCDECDGTAPGSAMPPGTIAVIGHGSNDRDLLSLSRTDWIEVDETGALAYRVGQPLVYLGDSGDAITLDEAVAVADRIKAVVARLAIE